MQHIKMNIYVVHQELTFFSSRSTFLWYFRIKIIVPYPTTSTRCRFLGKYIFYWGQIFFKRSRILFWRYISSVFWTLYILCFEVNYPLFFEVIYPLFFDVIFPVFDVIFPLFWPYISSVFGRYISFVLTLYIPHFDVLYIYISSVKHYISSVLTLYISSVLSLHFLCFWRYIFSASIEFFHCSSTVLVCWSVNLPGKYMAQRIILPVDIRLPFYLPEFNVCRYNDKHHSLI